MDCDYLERRPDSPVGWYCNSCKPCACLNSLVECPILEYAREYEGIVSGRLKSEDWKYYELQLLGYRVEKDKLGVERKIPKFTLRPRDRKTT
jgi:hypothetical protein